MDKIEEAAKWAVENRHNEQMSDGVFYDVLLNMIGNIVDDNNAENWEQNESSQ
jgi:hypothetical protein